MAVKYDTMNIPMKPLITACLLLALAPAIASAQEKEKTRTCRFIFPERPNDSPTEAYIFDGERSQKVLLPTLNFSRVIELPLGKITIVMTADAVNDLEQLPEGAPTVTIPASQNDLYFFIFEDPKNEVLPIRIQPVNIDNGELKVGETMWFNFSNRKIAAKLGSAELFIDPKKRAISKPPLSKSGYYLAKFLYKENGGTQYLPIMKKSWWFDEHSKNVGFIVDTGARMPKIYTFRDRRWATQEN